MGASFSKPLIIGHRGFSAKYPENTMVGFQAALAANVEMIELDVQLSSDGHPVVIHDDELDRTTDGKGPVTAYSLSELKKFDAGSWFDPRFENEPIPTLNEVLDISGPKGLINVEIKVNPGQGPETLRGIETITLAMIRRKGLLNQVLISSFNKYVLESLHQTEPAVALGVLTEFGEEIDIVKVCKALGAFSWHPHYLEADAEKIARMHADGIHVIPYTVNAENDINAVVQAGVDGFFTDDPVYARKIVGL